MNLLELERGWRQLFVAQLAGAIGHRIAGGFNAAQGQCLWVVEFNSYPFTRKLAAFADGELVGHAAQQGLHFLLL